MIEICKKINPYTCKYCGQEMLFIKTRRGKLIDYKNLYNFFTDSFELKEYLYNKEITHFKCIVCNREFMIDWTNGYPVQADADVIKNRIGVGC